MTGSARLLAIMGPTAAGKTELVLAAAERLGLGLVSVDSAQVYRGLDIGTAKPTAAEQARARHALIDIRDPWERYSAAAFRRDAAAAVDACEGRGERPTLVGGTMLYFRAFLGGLSPLPPADDALRATLAARAAREGWASLHAELATLDPPTAARIGPTDPQRIQRALEVCRLTGRPMSALLAEHRRPPRPVARLVLCPADRATLHQRIAARRDAMFAAGFVDEVRGLMAQPWFDPALPALRAVGYRQIVAHLAGAWGLAEARDRVLFATRQLAKRQLTWLRKEPDAVWLDPTTDRGRRLALEQLSRWNDDQL